MIRMNQSNDSDRHRLHNNDKQQQNRQNSLTNIEQRFSSSFRRGCSRGEEEYLRRIIMESLLIPKIRKQSLTLDVVYGNPTDDDFEAIDAKRAWVRGETLMRISPPRNNANAAENDDQSKIIQTTETTTERRRNRVKTLLFHAEKDLVEIDSIEIDAQGYHGTLFTVAHRCD